MRTSTLTVALVALLVLGAGTAGAFAATGSLQQQASPTGTTTTGSGGGTTTPSGGSGPGVTFNDQNSTGETVLVQSATLPQNGFVVIYDSTRSGNATNQIIGASYLLNAGTSDNIRIQLNQPLNESKSLTAVVHVDSNGNGNFDFVSSNGQQDPPLTQGDSRIVDIAQVTVQGSDAGGTNQTDAGGATGTSGGGATEADAGTQTVSGGGGGTGDGGTTATGGTNGGGGGGTNGGGGGGSGAFGPGFGLTLAVVALLAVALLAVRRN